MKPRKEIIDKAYKDGAIDKAAFLLALAYVTISTGNNIMEESNDWLDKYGLNIGEVKQAHNQFVKSADKYFKICWDIFSKECSALDYFKDLDDLEQKIKKWSDLDAKFKEIDERTRKDNSRANN